MRRQSKQNATVVLLTECDWKVHESLVQCWLELGAALDIQGVRADTEIAQSTCPWLSAAATMAAILTIALLAITILSSAEPPQSSANFTWLGATTPLATVQADAMVAQSEPLQAKLQP